MRRSEEARQCVVMVSVIGLYHTIEHVTCAALAAFLAAITTKNMSPLWAARRLLERAREGVVVRIDWIFPNDECEVGAKLGKIGGEIRLEGGGLGYEDAHDNGPTGEDGEVSGALAATVTAQVQYGPKHLLRWIAEAAEGPEKVGETEPLKTVPESPGEGHRGGVSNGAGEPGQTKINLWS